MNKPDIRYPARPYIQQTKIQYLAVYQIWKKAGYLAQISGASLNSFSVMILIISFKTS